MSMDPSNLNRVNLQKVFAGNNASAARAAMKVNTERESMPLRAVFPQADRMDVLNPTENQIKQAGITGLGHSILDLNAGSIFPKENT